MQQIKNFEMTVCQAHHKQASCFSLLHSRTACSLVCRFCELLNKLHSAYMVLIWLSGSAGNSADMLNNNTSTAVCRWCVGRPTRTHTAIKHHCRRTGMEMRCLTGSCLLEWLVMKRLTLYLALTAFKDHHSVARPIQRSRHGPAQCMCTAQCTALMVT